MASSNKSDHRAVLLDLEGTVTSVNFVMEVLSPFVQRELQAYLEQHWSDPNVQGDLEELVDHASKHSRESGEALPPQLDIDQSNLEAFRSEVISHIEWHLERDEHPEPLRSLRRRLLQTSAQSAGLNAPVFKDVRPALEHWQERGVPVYVFEEEGLDAQKLLFEHTEEGDLSPLIAGYFQASPGQKADPTAFSNIVDEVGVAPDEILYVTNSAPEADAAKQAGLKVAVIDRPNRQRPTDHDVPVIDSLNELFSPTS